MSAGTRTPFPLAALAWAARAIPAGADGAVAGAAAAVLARLVPEREAAALANLRRLFPERGAPEHARLARRAGTAYARFLLEYLRDGWRDGERPADRLRFAPPPGLVDALDRGRGLVACTAHLGNWELGALALSRLGKPLVVVAGPQYLPSWRDAVRRAKEGAGARVLSPEQAPAVLLRTLHAGGVVGLMVDGLGYPETRAARLGGALARLPTAPAKLAARTGAVLAAGTCLRRAPGTFDAELTVLAGSERAPVTDAGRLFDAMARWLEGVLLAHPGEWCIFRPFFGEPLGRPALPPALTRERAEPA